MAAASKCPFCGSGKQFVHEDASLAAHVACGGCDVQGPSGADSAAAIAAWNRRPEEERLDKKLAELELEDEIDHLTCP